MTLTSTMALLDQANAAGYAVPAFNVIGLEHAEAIVRGAEQERAPVILQISQNAIAYHFGAVAPIAAACRVLAETAAIPVALHVDHATSMALCEAAVAAGFSSLMWDEAASALDENVRNVRIFVTWAHARGVAVEGALGVVGGKDGLETSEEGLTDPERAGWYVTETGVDSLAVSVGTTHGMTRQTARIDLDRISALHAVTTVPLVLHGSSGAPDADLAEAARRGISKVNLATRLNAAFTGAVRQELAAKPDLVDLRKYLSTGRDAVIAVVREQLVLLGTSGRE